MINVVDTPNPETKKFVFEFEISEGSREFLQKDKNSKIKLVNDLFKIDFIELIFIDKNFISIKKKKIFRVDKYFTGNFEHYRWQHSKRYGKICF